MKDEGKKARDNLLRIHKGFYPQLSQIRNNASFHYGHTNEKIIKKSINDFKDDEGSCVILNNVFRGTRFIVADDIMNKIMLLSVGGTVDEMKAMIQQVADVQGNLNQFIDCLLVAYLKDRKLFNRIEVEEVL